jgi:diacylglycerol kinase (ATP)
LSRMLAVVNPVAGSGRAARVWTSLSPGGVECVATHGPGHARELARDAVARDVERVLAVGGDGTVSEVAAGLVGSGAALAIVPTGTGNDFARGICIPAQPELALRLALNGTPRTMDLGCLGIDGVERTFVNVAGCGFDAEVVRRLKGVPQRGAGSLVYLAGVLRTVLAYAPRPMRIEVDGRVVERRATGVALANGPRYGGGLRIAPHARVDDGLLDVCVVGAHGAVRILGLLPFIYLGVHARYPGVEFFRGRSVAVVGEAPCQADGELIGSLPATFRVEPRALRVVAP